ncbi:MAG: hypothetical protein RDV48_29535 [Candidatus Eremiobacteraeota bacterium]|nr:hypothetical protein [Candidatus Eremiobacteraeota bacterium]
MVIVKKLKVTVERQVEIHGGIDKISTARYSYYVLLMLSTIITACGLLANSTAVVIGAMLVAPLMGPVFGIALGLSQLRRGAKKIFPLLYIVTQGGSRW